jgi:PAS domain S-box-containing protein
MTTEEVAQPRRRTPEQAALFGSRISNGWRTMTLSIGYVALYLAFDRFSFIGTLHGIGITPWSPTAGLAIALLIIKGLRYSPLILAGELFSGCMLPTVSPPAMPIFLGSVAVTAGYVSVVTVLRHVGFQADLRRSSDTVLLLITTIIGSGFVASGFVGSYAVSGMVPWSAVAEAGFHYWIGDAIGIVVLLPPLLLLYTRLKQRAPPVQGWGPFHLGETAAQMASIVLALAVVFSRMGGDHPLGLFYLLFPPLIWIAARHGLPAASWAVLAIQVGLIAGLQVQDHTELTLRAFQLFMLALAATGLMLGAAVSERRRLSVALVDSEGLRTAILNTVPDGVLTIDARGAIQSINPAVETLFARPSHGLIGHDLSDLIESAPDLLSRLKLAIHSPASQARCWELDARRADGTTFPIELSAGRFDLLSAEHYTLVVRDITFRREAEARDRQHQAELAHVSRVSLAGEMAAALAHELSQPLTAIIAYTRGCLRLLAGPVPEPALLHEGMAEVVQQAERAGDVLDRLREFVRGGEFRRALIEIKPVIDAAVSLVHSEAMQRDVEIQARIDPSLPIVLADPVQIEQVLLNLLRNAMDAMEAANTERRSVIVEARRPGKHGVEISVADSGPGVAYAMIDTIFEPFVTTKPLGMGMGLSISRAIIEAHGGRLRLACRSRSGAIFFFTLPAAETEAGIDAG